MNSRYKLTLMVLLTFAFVSCNKDETPQETPNKAPTCEITSPNSGQEFTEGESITISVNAKDSDGSITEVKFFIDDVVKGSVNSSPYNYTWNTSGESIGDYTLKATSYDNDGSNSSNEISIKLIADSSGDAPIAEFTATPTNGTAPLTVNFTDQSQNSPTSWQWDFGDGNTSIEQNPSHIYDSEAYYSISLTVTNDDGSDTETKTDYIYVEAGAIGSFTDPRDGQTYVTIEIESQVWFAENLNYETANSWWYDDSSANGDIYGRLYTWDAAINACPSGWHLPSDEEWKTLEMFLGMSQGEANRMGWRGTDEGEEMKSISGWDNNGNGTNSSGFNALSGGDRFSNGSFNYLGSYGYWWSSSEYSGSSALYRYLSSDSPKVGRSNTSESDALSVRCLKD